MRLLRNLSWYSYVLIGLAALFLIASVGFYAFTTFDGHTIHGSRTSNFREKWHWNGQKVLLESTNKRNSTTCFITPEQGEARTVGLSARGKRGSAATGNRSKTLTAWFSGPATISCARSVTEYSGAALGRRKFGQSATFRFGAPLLVLLPIGAAILLGARRRRSSSSGSPGSSDQPWPSPPPTSSSPTWPPPSSPSSAPTWPPPATPTSSVPSQASQTSPPPSWPPPPFASPPPPPPPPPKD